MIHRGEVVLKIITQKNVNKSALADKLGISRTHLYNHLENADMPAFWISRIGEIIGFDFTKLIPEIARELKEIEEVNNPKEIFEENETLDLNIHLDGKEESLDRLILKLRALNEAIYQLSKPYNVYTLWVKTLINKENGLPWSVNIQFRFRSWGLDKPPYGPDGRPFYTVFWPKCLAFVCTNVLHLFL